MLPKLIELAHNMKTLKIISIISFLLLDGIQEHGTINFALILMYLFSFLHDIIHLPKIGIFWEGAISIPIIALLITLYASKNHQKTIILTCFILLYTTIPITTGLLNNVNYKRITFLGIIPLFIFIITSLFLIFLSFKNEKNKN